MPALPTAGDGRLRVVNSSRSQPQLQTVLLLKVLQAFGYYGVSITLTSFLTREFDLNDAQAGMLYGLYGMLISVASLLTGPLIDRLGIRVSVVVGACVVAASRVVLALTTSPRLCVAVLVTTLPIGESMGIPVLSLAVGAVSAPQDRQWAYGLFYTAMNVAVLAVGPTIDFLRAGGEASSVLGLPPYRLLIMLSAACGVVSALVAVTVLDIPQAGNALPEVGWGAAAEDPELQPPAEVSKAASGTVRREVVSADKRVLPWTISPKVLRYLVLVGCLVGVRMMFRHLDATFPKYVVRLFGEAAPFGLLYSINPAIIIVLVPLMSAQCEQHQSLSGGCNTAGCGPLHRLWRALVAAFAAIPGVRWLAALGPLDSMAVGTAISTLAALFPCLFPSMWAAGMFVVTLSIGEALW